MKFKHNFHQVDASQALMTYAEEEFDKVGRHLLTEGTCSFFYRMGRYDYQVQADVNTPWGHFKATGSSESFHIAVDEVAYKLGKQFQKAKEKHQHHKKTHRSKHAQFDRLNAELEYDNTPYLHKRSAS